MEKDSMTSIQDLVVQLITNLPEIEKGAENGDSKSCFQMGMSHLLGVNTPVDFKKASLFFSNQSLAEDQDVSLLRGFIAESEGNYSSAFQIYAKASGDNSMSLYIEKVIKGRKNLQDYLKKWGLPVEINDEVSAILDAYTKGGKSKVDASIQIAALCDDQSTCLNVAQCLYDINDYFSANKWLQKGNISTDDPLAISINKEINKTNETLKQSTIPDVVILEGDSLLPNREKILSLDQVKKKCDNDVPLYNETWKQKVSQLINPIKEEEEKQQRLSLLLEEGKRNSRKESWLLGVLFVGWIMLIPYIISRCVNDLDDIKAFWFGSFFTATIATVFSFLLLRPFVIKNNKNKIKNI